MTSHLVGPQEVCEILGVSRQRLQQLAARPDFPEPVVELALGRVWETEAIRAWAEKTGRLVQEDDDEDSGD
jgi:predicted DNA-binding transcriptional regulator AlpA